MTYIVDRFEGKYEVLEDENRDMLNVPIKDLPKDVQVGDVLVKAGDGYQVDVIETEKRKKRMKELMDDLWNE